VQSGGGNHTHSGNTTVDLPEGQVGMRFAVFNLPVGSTPRRMISWTNPTAGIEYFTEDIVQPTPLIVGTAHSHSFSIGSSGSHNHNLTGSLATEPNHGHGLTGSVGSGPNGDLGLSSGANGAGSPVDRNPPFVTVNYIIKT